MPALVRRRKCVNAKYGRGGGEFGKDTARRKTKIPAFLKKRNEEEERRGAEEPCGAVPQMRLQVSHIFISYHAARRRCGRTGTPR